jgi:hypothetical protein
MIIRSPVAEGPDLRRSTFRHKRWLASRECDLSRGGSECEPSSLP